MFDCIFELDFVKKYVPVGKISKTKPHRQNIQSTTTVISSRAWFTWPNRLFAGVSTYSPYILHRFEQEKSH